MTNPEIIVYPATAERWQDLATLFSQQRATSGCWCMFWRLRRADFSKMKDEEKKAALRDLARGGHAPGVIAYDEGQPVGWCSIGPREEFAALERSRILKRIDDAAVWSIVCFFIAKPYRRRGMMTTLIRGAVRYAVEQGAKIVEGYPIDMHSHLLEGKRLTGYSGYMGIASAFKEAGFVQVGEASDTQRIMRYVETR
ncbi:MAG: GNAT family N-acetyltransferase [Anaerolineales bacterium]|nr:GNAT family N-acetyltransferase [Anaerolineales bacterium]